jgi:hypothetical protein
MKKSAIMLSVVVLGLGLLAGSVEGGTVTDDFSVAHVYSVGNVAGTIWDGIRYNEGDISGVVADANTTTAGELHFESANGGYTGNMNDGLLLYVNVDGNFVAEVQATSASSANYNGVGLIARLADPAADGDAGEDWVYLTYDGWMSRNLVRSADNNVVTETSHSRQQFLQMERSGDDIILRSKANAVDSWSDLTTVTRADLNGLPLQVGIWQGSFSGSLSSGTLDNFSLTGPNVGAVATPGTLIYGK